MSVLRYTTIAAAGAAITGAVVLAVIPTAARGAVALGLALATLNTIISFGLASWTEGRSATALMQAVLGGMVARMAVMLAVVVGAVVWLGLPRVPLAFSLLGYFLAFLLFELAVLHRRRSASPLTS